MGHTSITRRLVFFVFKLAIFIGLMYIILKRWYDHPLSTEPLIQVFKSKGKTFYFILCWLLMIPNWLMEAKIWQYLNRSFQKISLLQSTKAVLSGLTMGILTPFMTGDYVGRVWHLPKEKRKDGIAANLLGSYIFTLLSIHLGTLGLHYYWLNWAHENTAFYSSLQILLYAMWFASLGGILLATTRALNILTKIKFLKPYLSALTSASLKQQAQVYFLALVRYAIFLFQFVLLFWAFGVSVPIVPMIGGILLIFLAKTIGSGINIFGDLTIREVVGIGYFGMFGVDLGATTWVIFLLWLLNIIFPALMGYYFISVTKISQVLHD